jgi:CheY-like chemotaxis protein
MESAAQFALLTSACRYRSIESILKNEQLLAVDSLTGVNDGSDFRFAGEEMFGVKCTWISSGALKNPEHLLPVNPERSVVLVVDDEVLVVNIARIALEGEGYFVLAARDGEEALELSRKFPGIIHAMLSDVNMPKMDGLQLRQQILIERPQIKALLMSGQVDPPDDNCPFLRKPFHISVLKERMRQLLASAASG